MAFNAAAQEETKTPLTEEPVIGTLAFTAFPDAFFGVFMDPATLQEAMYRLPIPATQAVAQQLGQLEGRAAVIAFLGTAPGPGYQVHIQDIRARDRVLEVVVDSRAPATLPSGPVSYTYPVDARALSPADLPPPPFQAVFRTPDGHVLAEQSNVRPVIPPLSQVPREEDAGDMLSVVRTLQHRYQDGPWEGQVIVRVHEIEMTLYWSTVDDGVVIYADLPAWFRPRSPDPPSCVVIDRRPEEIVQDLRGANAYSLLTLRGVRAEVNPPAHLPARIDPEEMPTQAWMACHYSVRSVDARSEWLGTEVVDLYPARLEGRPPQTVEVVESRVPFHDIYLALRLHPRPTAEAVPLELVVLDPPIREENGTSVAVGAYLYYGFDREPSQSTYAISLHSDAEGRFYTWLLAPEGHTFRLYARLGHCTASQAPTALSLWNPSPDARCDTNTVVQAFYTHAGYLRGLGFNLPLSLRLQIRSPHGWQSDPFTLEIPPFP